VLDHVPGRDRLAVKRRLRAAWKLTSHEAAIERLEALAGELSRSHPGAAPRYARAWPRQSPCGAWASMSSSGECSPRRTDRVDDRLLPSHQPQRQALAERRHVPALDRGGMLEAEAQFRRIIGYRHLAALALAVERDVAAGRTATSRSATPSSPTTTRPQRPLRPRPSPDHQTATAKFHDKRDNLVRRSRTDVEGVNLLVSARTRLPWPMNGSDPQPINGSRLRVEPSRGAAQGKIGIPPSQIAADSGSSPSRWTNSGVFTGQIPSHAVTRPVLIASKASGEHATPIP
jgi:hypothetical protein